MDSCPSICKKGKWSRGRWVTSPKVINKNEQESKKSHTLSESLPLEAEDLTNLTIPFSLLHMKCDKESLPLYCHFMTRDKWWHVLQVQDLVPWITCPHPPSPSLPFTSDTWTLVTDFPEPGVWLTSLSTLNEQLSPPVSLYCALHFSVPRDPLKELDMGDSHFRVFCH